jgi:hypothetical protein
VHSGTPAQPRLTQSAGEAVLLRRPRTLAQVSVGLLELADVRCQSFVVRKEFVPPLFRVAAFATRDVVT